MFSEISGLPPAEILRRLFWLRGFAVLGQLGLVLGVHYGLGMQLPLASVLLVPMLLSLLNLLVLLRLGQSVAVTETEVFMHLCVDLGALAVLLFFTGGSSNPFVSLFLVPVVLGAASLAPMLAWTITTLATLAYTLLLFIYVPLPAPPSGGATAAFSLHVTGMWLNFLFSAALMAFFVTRITHALRERDRLLADVREQALRQEQVVALGALAAGAAHELSTPLGTIRLLSEELEHALGNDPALAGEARLLRDEAERCKRILTQVVDRAGAPRGEHPRAERLDHWLAQALSDWQAAHPDAMLQRSLAGARPAPRILDDPTLRHAIFNLLQNAFEASPAEVAVEAQWDDARLSLCVLDRGPGLTPRFADAAGKQISSTKRERGGLGVGLFLARATMERLGGTLTLQPRSGSGTIASLELPLRLIRMEDS
ncbi:MAG: ATP-binding protein [Thiotrichales bacterium]